MQVKTDTGGLREIDQAAMDEVVAMYHDLWDILDLEEWGPQYNVQVVLDEDWHNEWTPCLVIQGEVWDTSHVSTRADLADWMTAHDIERKER